jgi:hypothetical protein
VWTFWFIKRIIAWICEVEIVAQANVSAEQEVDVSVDQARDWFLALKGHPERYRFETHLGLDFVRGDFGAVGSRFKTREKFYFLELELFFELVGVDESSFRFRLVSPPWMDIWGAFQVAKLGPQTMALRLEIGSGSAVGRALLGFYPVETAIRRQVTKEVGHIKKSMEDLYGDGR